jgi:hypothetical protein
VNGSVSGLASSGRSATALASPEADSPEESSWLACAGVSAALCALTPPLSFAAEAALEALRAEAVPELDADSGAAAEVDWRGAAGGAAAGAEAAGAGAAAAGAGAAAGGAGAGAGAGGAGRAGAAGAML